MQSYQKNAFAFRKFCSCIHAIMAAAEILRTSEDSKNKKFACFKDFQKKFDNIDHTILTKKLEGYGFRGICYSLV